MKLFLIFISLGTFNFFLSSSTDLKSIPKQVVQEEKAKVQGMSLTGEVVLQSKLPKGEIQILIYSAGQFDFLTEVSKQEPFLHAVHKSTVSSDGTFSVENIEKGIYDVKFVYYLLDFSYLPLSCETMGGTILEGMEIENGMDIYVSLSHEAALFSN